MSVIDEKPLPRIKPSNITPVAQTQFCQWWEARTLDDLRDCVHPLYLNPIRQRLQAGDRVSLCQFTDTSWSKMVAVLSVRVVHINGGDVYLKPEGPIIGCDLNAPTNLDGELAPVKLKRLQEGRIGIVGLEKFGLEDVSFADQEEAMLWIERNSNSVYLEKNNKAA